MFKFRRTIEKMCDTCEDAVEHLTSLIFERNTTCDLSSLT